MAGLVVLGAGTTAQAADDELPSGRLGYRWTPAPPSQPTSGPDQRTIDAVKYGGGAVLVLWILRKLTRAD